MDNTYADDTTTNNDKTDVQLRIHELADWFKTLLAYIKKAAKLLIEIAKGAQELIQSARTKVRQAAAGQIRRAFKDMPLNRQERVSQLLTSLHDVLENAAQFLEQPGARATSTMQWMGIHGEFGKFLEQLLQEIAQWLRQYDGDVQDDTAQALVDMTFWGPVLNKLGWGAGGIVKGSVAAARHSKLNPVVARSWFAKAQSAGQNGYGKAVFDRIVQVPVASRWLVEEVDWDFLARWFEETDLVPQTT
ncbi:hypothetical protein PG984_001497 [Apiospora sp. TS-2023a]